MKEVWEASGLARISSLLGAVGSSVPAPASRSPGSPTRVSSYVPRWRGSRLGCSSRQERRRLSPVRSSAGLPASVRAPWQRYADVWTHPPTGATAPTALRHPSWPGGTVLRRSTDHWTSQSGAQRQHGNPAVPRPTALKSRRNLHIPVGLRMLTGRSRTARVKYPDSPRVGYPFPQSFGGSEQEFDGAPI